jgi:hypothetical protein
MGICGKVIGAHQPAVLSAGSVDVRASKMQRRTFLTLSAATAASAAFPFKARAMVPKPYTWDASPPMNDTAAFVRWMQENRGEDPRYLRARFERFQNMVGHVDFGKGATSARF